MEPVSNLLRTPRTRPAARLTVPAPPTDPAHNGARHIDSVSGGDDACESVLHILAQFVVCSQLRNFRTTGALVGVPLGRCGSILQVATAGRSVPTQFPRESLMDIGRSDARSHESRSPERVRSRSLLVRQTTDSAPKARPNCLTACRHSRGTTSFRPPATRRPPPPASSLDNPRAIASQNRCRCSRRPTGGRPGDGIGRRPARSLRRRLLVPIATPHFRDVATTD